MELTNEVFEALDRYFYILSKQGYKNYCEVNKLLVLSFIEELLTGPMSSMVTEEDYWVIMRGVSCLGGSCLIPYALYKESVVNINKELLL